MPIDPDTLLQLPYHGVWIVTSGPEDDPSIDMQTRVFFPSIGLAEDHVSRTLFTFQTECIGQVRYLTTQIFATGLWVCPYSLLALLGIEVQRTSREERKCIARITSSQSARRSSSATLEQKMGSRGGYLLVDWRGAK